MPAEYENGLLVGFCLAARQRGARIFCRHDVAIVHPTSLWAEQVYRVTSCRSGDSQSWRELAQTVGTVVAGPYFDFVIPEAVRILATSSNALAGTTTVAFASNPRREIVILLGDGNSLPPAPEGFGAVALSQPMPIPTPTPAAPCANKRWWMKVFSR